MSGTKQAEAGNGAPEDVLLRCFGICKNFGPTKALQNVDFTLKRGEVHGLVGENGSGKSTLSSIIAGVHKPTSGTMELNGTAWAPKNTLYARENGVGIIVQEAGTIPSLTVAQNIFLGQESLFQKGLIVDSRAMNTAADKVLSEIGAEHIGSYQPVSQMNGNDRKLVEVAKAYNRKPDIFIVDETTNTLSADGRDLLFSLMRKIVEDRKAVLIISHDIEELMAHCDKITVLKDGKYVGTLDKQEFDAQNIKNMMIGRELTGNYYRNDMDLYEQTVVLRADRITTPKDIVNLSLELHRGEILGIGGLSDCGMHTLGRALFGEVPLASGRVEVCATKTGITNAETAVKSGMAYLSKERGSELLAVNGTIRDNIAIQGLNENSLLKFFVSGQKENRYVDRQVESLRVKCNSKYDTVNSLSGGNMQKVGFAKWLANSPDILIMDCPTRGIDIGVKQEIYRLMYNIKKQGKAIILISEEMPELIGMSDRLLVMKNGKITKEFRRDENITERAVIQYMI